MTYTIFCHSILQILQILADLKLNKWIIVKKQNNASLKNVIKYHIIIL